MCIVFKGGRGICKKKIVFTIQLSVDVAVPSTVVVVVLRETRDDEK